jgi:hypothetical protein
MEHLKLEFRDKAISVWKYRYEYFKIVVLQYDNIYLVLYS